MTAGALRAPPRGEFAENALRWCDSSASPSPVAPRRHITGRPHWRVVRKHRVGRALARHRRVTYGWAVGGVKDRPARARTRTSPCAGTDRRPPASTFARHRVSGVRARVSSASGGNSGQDQARPPAARTRTLQNAQGRCTTRHQAPSGAHARPRPRPPQPIDASAVTSTPTSATSRSRVVGDVRRRVERHVARERRLRRPATASSRRVRRRGALRPRAASAATSTVTGQARRRRASRASGRRRPPPVRRGGEQEGGRASRGHGSHGRGCRSRAHIPRKGHRAAGAPASRETSRNRYRQVEREGLLHPSPPGAVLWSRRDARSRSGAIPGLRVRTDTAALHPTAARRRRAPATGPGDRSRGAPRRPRRRHAVVQPTGVPMRLSRVTPAALAAMATVQLRPRRCPPPAPPRASVGRARPPTRSAPSRGSPRRAAETVGPRSRRERRPEPHPPPPPHLRAVAWRPAEHRPERPSYTTRRVELAVEPHRARSRTPR